MFYQRKKMNGLSDYKFMKWDQ